jgi:hypothetical protein
MTTKTVDFQDPSTPEAAIRGVKKENSCRKFSRKVSFDFQTLHGLCTVN